MELAPPWQHSQHHSGLLVPPQQASGGGAGSSTANTGQKLNSICFNDDLTFGIFSSQESNSHPFIHQQWTLFLHQTSGLLHKLGLPVVPMLGAAKIL